MTAVHDFKISLEKSNQQADAPWWDQVYQKAFPNLRARVNVRNDGWAQRGGIDCVLTLSSGKTLTVDEKVREAAWPDFALERWSDKARRTPGWIQKDLAIDYIAYAFVPTQDCYLLPFQALRMAWREHGLEWIRSANGNEQGFSVIDAQNLGYVTESIGVPIPIVLSAIKDSFLVSWRAE